MEPLYCVLVAAPAALLLGTALVPSSQANRFVKLVRPIALALTLTAMGAAAGASILLVLQGPLDVAIVSWNTFLPINLGVYFDSLSSLMSLLITMIGAIIVRYSIRYLDGEVTQGRFLKWLLFTLGSVLLMVVSRNVLMLTAAWMLTSLGLHQLLTHYPDRPWAQWAARKKFLISRLGDLFLISAIVMLYSCCGSFDYQVIFAHAQELALSQPVKANPYPWIGLFLVLGAMTKSAQVPFHSWLPDTMETPTPVSALMHAGVINAGGFLIIRLSPVMSHAPEALNLLALCGGFTAVVGSVVMLTQTSIKRSLAYSTIAQMGFMMLQCGLGAYSAALLHLIAHSLYKAHAFLSSGSVLEAASQLPSARKRDSRPVLSLPSLALCLLLPVSLYGATAWIWQINLLEKPGALILGLILCLSLTQLMAQAFMSSTASLKARAILVAAFLSWFYLGSWLAIDRILSFSSVAHLSPTLSSLHVVMLAILIIAFLGTFSLQWLVTSGNQSVLLRSLYVHASHGFYLDIPARRITAKIWGSTAPTP